MARFVAVEDVVKWLEARATKDLYGSYDYMAAFDEAAEKLDTGEWQKELNEAEAKDK